MRRKPKPGRKRKRARAAPLELGQQGRGATERSDWLGFACVVALAAVLRVSYALASRHSPFFDHLDLDSRFYDLWAKRIASGDWVGDEVFFMGPLYPYFLALIYKVAGHSLLTVKIVQSLLGGLTAGIVYLLGRECFGVIAGLIAGFLAAMYVPFLFYDNSILFPVLATLLNTMMLYFLYLGVVRGNTRWFAIGGMCAGLSAAGNASVLAFGPLAVGFLLIFGKMHLRVRLKAVGFFVAGIAVIVAPIAVRNLVIGKDLVPLTSNAGLNLFIGNNQKSTGAYVKPEGLDVFTDPSGRTIAEAARGGVALKPSEVSDYWTSRAIDFAKSNPADFASNMLRKVFLFWSVYEIPQIEHLPFEKRYSWLLRIPSPSFGIVCPLGILGMFLSLRRRREAWLLFLFIMSYSVTIITFFVVARYRLPMVPALMVFAASSVVWWIRAGRQRRYKPLAYSVLGFIALFAVVHINFYRIDPMSGFAQSYYRLGIIREDKGDLAGAMESYRRSLAIDRSIAAVHLNLGILLSRQHRYQEAKQELLEALDLDPDYARAYYNLGLVYSEEAVNDSALLMMDKALELQQDYSLAMLGKASIYYELARFAASESLLVLLKDDLSLPEQSRKQIDGLLTLIPQRSAWVGPRQAPHEKASDLHLLRGDNLLAIGLVGRALEAYTRAIQADGRSGVALYQAATVYFNSGKFEEARIHFDRALEVAPTLRGAHFGKAVIAFRTGDIETACREFEAELEINPRSSVSHMNLAMCYEEHLNDLRRAAYHISRYIELTGGTEDLRNHLKELRGRIGDENG